MFAEVTTGPLTINDKRAQQPCRDNGSYSNNEQQSDGTNFLESNILCWNHSIH